MQKLYYSSIIILLIVLSFNEVTVRLLDYSAKEDHYQCTENLLVNGSLHIFGEINFSETKLDVINSRISMLVGESLESLRLFYYRRLQHCRGPDNLQSFSCSVSSNKAEVLLIVEASKILSNKFLQLKLDLNVNNARESYFSQLTQLPKIFDFSDIKLNCNNKILGGNVNTVHLPSHEMRINICCQEAPKPCYVVLSSAEVFISSRYCVTHLRNSKEKEFSIGYSVCGNLRLNQFKLLFTNGDSKSSSPTNCQSGNQFNDADILFNNIKLGVDINTLYLPSNEVKLNVCCQASPRPCNLVLTSKGILITSNSCATYLRNAKENVFFITYSVCGNVRLNIFKLLFMNQTEANNSESNETSQLSTTIIYEENPSETSTKVDIIQSGNRTIDKPEETTSANVTLTLGDIASPSTDSENLEAFLIATVVMASVAASFTISTVIACYRYHSTKKKRLKDNYDELDTRITDRVFYHRPQVNAKNSSSSCASGYLDVVSSRSSSPRDTPAEAGTDANPYAEIGEMCIAVESKTTDE